MYVISVDLISYTMYVFLLQYQPHLGQQDHPTEKFKISTRDLGPDQVT